MFLIINSFGRNTLSALWSHFIYGYFFYRPCSTMPNFSVIWLIFSFELEIPSGICYASKRYSNFSLQNIVDLLCEYVYSLQNSLQVQGKNLEIPSVVDPFSCILTPVWVSLQPHCAICLSISWNLAVLVAIGFFLNRAIK